MLAEGLRLDGPVFLTRYPVGSFAWPGRTQLGAMTESEIIRRYCAWSSRRMPPIAQSGRNHLEYHTQLFDFQRSNPLAEFFDPTRSAIRGSEYNSSIIASPSFFGIIASRKKKPDYAEYGERGCGCNRPIMPPWPRNSA